MFLNNYKLFSPMNQKHIGIVIIFIALILFILTIFIHLQVEDHYIEMMLNLENDTCFLPDGTCLHENPYEWMFVVMYFLEGILIFIGGRIGFLRNDTIQYDRKRREFEQYLKGFNADQKRILKILYDHDGIWQSTLRIKSGMSKAKLSQVLQELEDRGHIKKEKKGKTFEVFLKEF